MTKREASIIAHNLLADRALDMATRGDKVDQWLVIIADRLTKKANSMQEAETRRKDYPKRRMRRKM